jgi:hypothetical protein
MPLFTNVVEEVFSEVRLLHVLGMLHSPNPILMPHSCVYSVLSKETIK